MSEYMIFCVGDGKWERKGEGYQKNNRVFSQDVTHEEYIKIRNSLSEVKIQHTRWIEEKDMTDEEQKNHTSYKEIGGYLKVISYKEAWTNFWASANQTLKSKITGLKQFDADIFLKITGVDVTVDTANADKKAKILAKIEELKKEANSL